MGILSDITGGLSKNPSFLALAALGIGLFIFRDKISGFFSDITGGAAGAAQVAETGGILAENLQSNLTGIQDILSGDIFKGFEFPTFQFPTIEFPTLTLPDIPEFIPDIFAPRAVSTDITETPAAIGRASQRGRITEMIESIIPTVQSAIEGQQFTGGGPSFIGGVVTPTPITGESTLGFIIDQLGVTASQAADIRAQAQGFTPEEESFLGIGLNPPAVSDPTFTGLSPEEIALRLTGGTITNF